MNKPTKKAFREAVELLARRQVLWEAWHTAKHCRGDGTAQDAAFVIRSWLGRFKAADRAFQAHLVLTGVEKTRELELAAEKHRWPEGVGTNAYYRVDGVKKAL